MVFAPLSIDTNSAGVRYPMSTFHPLIVSSFAMETAGPVSGLPPLATQVITTFSPGLNGSAVDASVGWTGAVKLSVLVCASTDTSCAYQKYVRLSVSVG